MYMAANGAAGAKCDVCDCVVYRCEWQVVQSQLYGCTYEFVKHYLKEKLDVEVTFVDSANVDEFKAAIRPDTKVRILYSVIIIVNKSMNDVHRPSFTPDSITVILSTTTYQSFRLPASNRFRILLPVYCCQSS